MSQLFLDTVRAFAARAVEPVAADIDRLDRVPVDLVSIMRDMDLLTVDEDGPEQPVLLDAIEILARSSASVAMLVAAPLTAAELLSSPEQPAAGQTPASTGLRGVRVQFAASAASIERRREVLLGIAAVAVGVASRAHDLTAAYAATRSAFGRKLTDFPVLDETLAKIGARIVLTRALLAHAIDADNLPSANEAARTATEAAVSVAFSAIQLHGGYGYMTEYGVERLARDAVSLRALVSGLTAPETHG